MSFKPRAGFTLVELLVVIGIISLLISILLPTLSSARQSANSVLCQSNLRQVGQLVVLYANDNDGLTVPAWSQNHYHHYADTLSIMMGQPNLETPNPAYPAGHEQWAAEQVLPIFQDVDVPLDTWGPRATSYVGNIRILGGNSFWDPLKPSAPLGTGYRQRQLSGIEDAAAKMMMWDGAVEINPTDSTNYGVWHTFPDALDGWQM